ncbi:MAG: hypothetical protein JWP01_2499 [Myxococcales bacterium]|nr:hypothetical protein [Myxococcales bacterium]
MPRGKNKKPRSERKKQQPVLTDEQQYQMELLENLCCPTATAERVVEVAGLQVEAFTLLNSASYVWRDQPKHAEIQEVIVEMRRLIEVNLSAIVELGKKAGDLMQAETEHEDLEPKDVVARLEPMFKEMEAELAADGDSNP